MEVGIWYPSTGPINRTTLGPFDVSYAENGKPVDGFFPVILMSHGIGGRYRNHHLTASRLVEDGYVVVAPTHINDMTVSKGAIVARMEFRQHDLTAAMVALTNDPVLSPIAQLNDVNGIGYSLGSASILIAAGARFDTNLLDLHCEDNGLVDTNFCDWIDGGFWQTAWDWIVGNGKSQKGEYSSPMTLISGKISLIAPIGQGLDLAAINASKGKVQVLSLGDDDQVIPMFHAKVLLRKIGVDKLNFLEYPGTHHYAFIAPFPKWLTDKEDIPVAKDPPGFDRMTFLTKINNDIAGFFMP